MTPNLNWREWRRLAEAIAPETAGLFVDRVVVPARPEFPGGYLKGEWTLRLSGRKGEAALTVSVRPRNPYVILERGKGRKAAEGATHSAFDLGLSKNLKGARLLEIEAVERERTLILWFSAPTEEGRLGLVVTLIPAQPEAYLIIDPGMKVLAHSRQAEIEGGARFVRPDGLRAPESPEIREELVRDPESFRRAVEEALSIEAFQLRLQRLDRTLAERIRMHSKRVAESRVSLRKVEEEPDYARWGDCLKAVLHSPPPLREGKRLVMDYVTGQEIEIPCDPQLEPREQLERFYHLAKRRSRKREECASRLDLALESLEELKPLQEARLALAGGAPDFAELARLELAAGLSDGGSAPADAKQAAAGVGKRFLSSDGMTIWVGRSREENMELSFRLARGNDVWLHVKGRPGSHVLIPIPPKKSAPLDTLLDAATLAVYYSGGENWGKTEVDYTFRKYVKRIRQSTEVSYTNNKTLIVDAAGARLQRLLAQAAKD